MFGIRARSFWGEVAERATPNKIIMMIMWDLFEIWVANDSFFARFRFSVPLNRFSSLFVFIF